MNPPNVFTICREGIENGDRDGRLHRLSTIKQKENRRNKLKKCVTGTIAVTVTILDVRQATGT